MNLRRFLNLAAAFAAVAAAAAVVVVAASFAVYALARPYVGEAGAAAARTLDWRVGPRQAVRQGDWKLLREPARGGGGKAGKAAKGGK